MLVLTRRLKESIKIGDEIEVTVLEINGDQVKLGISAPKNIQIYRQEIYLQIQQENSRATTASVNLLKEFSELLKRGGNNTDRS
jgi:carbon storage regulator